MSGDLLLHWPLDHLTPGGLALDSSGNRRNGTVEGAPIVKPDERFGSCLVLDGVHDAVSLGNVPDLRSTAYTAEAWIRAETPSADARMVIVGTVDGFSVSVDAQGALHHTLPGGASYASRPGALEPGAWHHVAVTGDGSSAVTYLDGTEIARAPVPAGAAAAGAAPVAGRDPATGGDHLAGSIAHVRVYDGSLGPVEIQRDRDRDESASAAFTRAHPLDFDLFNADGQHVLYIDDAPAGQTMTLRIVNTSRDDLELRSAGPEASETDHHLALRFRAGILAGPPVLRTPGWSMKADATTLRLLRTDPMVIEAGGSTDLELAGVRADGAGGTRGTRVEGAYRRMGYVGRPEEVTGSRLHFLEVVNQQGRPDIPLHVGFAGGDRVLSDGVSPSSLCVRLANVSPDTAIRLSGTASAGDAASRFVLSFDVQHPDEEREWALTDAGEADGVILETAAGPPVEWDIAREDLGRTVQWTITPREDTELSPASPLDLRLSNIHALPLAGHAPITVAHRDIPGHQDGFDTVMAERTPLLYTADDVMIGTTTPSARLTVSAEKDHLRLYREPSTAATGAVLFLDLVQDETPVQVHPGIGFEQTGLFQHRIEGRPDGLYLRSGPPESESAADLHVKFVRGDGAALASLRVTDNAGIGTDVVPARLTVGAASDHLQLRRDTAPPAGNKVLFLELFQNDAADVVYPSIRFHHSNRFWHRLEARPEGLYLKTGQLDSDDLADLYTRALNATSLTIGGVVIGRGELEVLRRLAAGQLEIDLLNVAHNAYAYASDIAYDAQRAYMFASGTAGDYRRWRVTSPR
ncbi:LamG domain-containing protein [Actinomadura bangladeshensis]|nr:LamG domain-containing protein [Actinomadura bangladeshensis]